MSSLIKNSIASVILVSLGIFSILSVEHLYVSAVLFTLGLFTVCKLKLNLFTGKCGFIFENNKWGQLMTILGVNMGAGYLLGLLYSTISENLYIGAALRVETWEVSWSYFLRAVLCGVLMYIACKLYQVGTPIGIFIGVPMFILCGFQHCIANVIYMGVARTFHPAILIATLGNFVGAVVVWWIFPRGNSNEEKPVEASK